MASDSDRDWRDRCTIVQEKHSHLLTSGKFSDVVFVVGNNAVPIHAHKFVLMVASPVFEIKFGERWNKENDNSIQILNVTPKAFELFLKFLYTDEFTVTEEEVEDVLGLSHQYMIKSLAKECSKLLESVMKVSNVVNIHRIANKFATVEESLQMKAMEFMLKNGSAVMEDVGFLEIDESTLSMILKNDKLCSNEITVFAGVMRWAEKRCRVQKLEQTVDNKRNILKDLITHVRFTLMGLTDFTNVVMIENEGILPQAESIGIIKHINAAPNTSSHLPNLPFNTKKRCGGFLYFVDVYELEREKRANKIWRHSFPHNYHDYSRYKTILRLRSSHSICVKAIELWPHYDSKEVHHLTFDSSEPMRDDTLYFGIFASLSLVTHTEAALERMRLRKTLVGKLLPKPPTNMESENGFQIEKDKDYWIKLVINNGDGSYRKICKESCTPSTIRRELVGSVDAVCQQENVKFTFEARPTLPSCSHASDPKYRAPGFNCDCDCQIKTIHFTIL